MRIVFATLLIAIGCVSPRFATAAPDNTFGMALLGARVGPTGTLVTGSGVVTTAWPSIGQYLVTFGRDVSQCLYSVSPYDPNRFPFVEPQSIDPTQVYVGIQDGAGAYSNGEFYLLVFCSR